MKVKHKKALKPQVPDSSQRLLGGYRLAVGCVERTPEYLPAMNQVWLPCDLPSKETLVALSHEFIHAYMTSLQPSRLLPLNSALISTYPANQTERFRDIVETACDLYYWLKILLPDKTNIEHYAEKSSYPKLYSELATLGKQAARKASKQLSTVVALERAISTICVLLMHIVPHKADLGSTIIKAIRSIGAPKNWQSKQELLWSLYRCLDEKRAGSETMKKRVSLALPIGVHRYIIDTIYFVATAIRAVELRPGIVTAVFPTLLGLLTQSSFVLLPVVTLKRVKKSYSAQIKVIHTTYHSPRDPDRLAIKQRQIEYKARKDGKYCRAVPIFIDLINTSKPFRLSNDKDRTVRCFETLLHRLADLIKEHVREKSNCSGCMLSFREKSFKFACRTIINITAVQKAALLEAVEYYEHFLCRDIMTYMRIKWQLDENPRPLPRYRFL